MWGEETGVDEHQTETTNNIDAQVKTKMNMDAQCHKVVLSNSSACRFLSPSTDFESLIL